MCKVKNFVFEFWKRKLFVHVIQDNITKNPYDSLLNQISKILEETRTDFREGANRFVLISNWEIEQNDRGRWDRKSGQNREELLQVWEEWSSRIGDLHVHGVSGKDCGRWHSSGTIDLGFRASTKQRLDLVDVFYSEKEKDMDKVLLEGKLLNNELLESGLVRVEWMVNERYLVNAMRERSRRGQFSFLERKDFFVNLNLERNWPKPWARPERSEGLAHCTLYFLFKMTPEPHHSQNVYYNETQKFYFNFSNSSLPVHGIFICRDV